MNKSFMVTLTLFSICVFLQCTNSCNSFQIPFDLSDILKTQSVIFNTCVMTVKVAYGRYHVYFSFSQNSEFLVYIICIHNAQFQGTWKLYSQADFWFPSCNFLYLCSICISYMDIHKYTNYLLSTYYVPGTVLDVKYCIIIPKSTLPNFLKRTHAHPCLEICPKFHNQNVQELVLLSRYPSCGSVQLGVK